MNRLYRNSETARTARKAVLLASPVVARYAVALWRVLNDELDTSPEQRHVCTALLAIVPLAALLLLIYLLRLHLPCA
jgi:hypothetical protein